MRRRRVLHLGLGGIAALGVLSRIGAQRAMAADGHETFVYVSNAGTKDIYVLGMNRETGELTIVEKVPVPGAEKTSLVSLPMALAPNKRFIYAQLRSEPYPVSTFSIDHTNGKLTHLDAAPLADQMAYINVDKTGKHLLGASYTGAKVAVYPIDAR
jgi:6-phosphogluconolactonase